MWKVNSWPWIWVFWVTCFGFKSFLKQEFAMHHIINHAILPLLFLIQNFLEYGYTIFWICSWNVLQFEKKILLWSSHIESNFKRFLNFKKLDLYRPKYLNMTEMEGVKATESDDIEVEAESMFDWQATYPQVKSFFLAFHDKRSRRSSMFIPRRSMAESIVSLMSRGSLVPEPCKKPNFLNTYKLYPDDKPNIRNIEKVIKKVVAVSTQDMAFEDCCDSNVCTVLNNELHNRVKKLMPLRYRFLIQIIICEKADQDTCIATRWLWNDTYDNHCTVQTETPTMSVTVVFHSLYLE